MAMVLPLRHSSKISFAIFSSFSGNAHLVEIDDGGTLGEPLPSLPSGFAGIGSGTGICAGFGCLLTGFLVGFLGCVFVLLFAFFFIALFLC